MVDEWEMGEKKVGPLKYFVCSTALDLACQSAKGEKFSVKFPTLFGGCSAADRESSYKLNT